MASDAERGRFFRGLRLAHKWNQSETADRARRRGMPALTRQVVIGLESGKTQNPNPEALKAYAVLFKVPYEVLASLFPRHHVVAAPVGPDAVLVEKLEAVTAERDRYEQLLKKLSTIADEYARLREAVDAE